MKKIMIVSYCVIFIFLTDIYAMHETSMNSEHIADAGIAMPVTNHEPSLAAIATPYKSLNMNNDIPVQATVLKSSQPSVTGSLKIQDDLAISNKTHPQLKKSQSLSFDDAMPIAIAEPVVVKPADKAQPIVMYDAKGNKVSEHLINDDGSEQNTVYETNGDVVTTLLDSNKVRQQVITKKPNHSSVIQYYDKQGKQISVEIINPDGSRVKTVNTLGFQLHNADAGIIDSQIYNKQNQLEASLSLNDFGQAIISTHNVDGSITTHNPDRTITTTITNDDGSSTNTTRNVQGEVTKINITHADGTTETTSYNSGVMYNKVVTHVDGSTETTYYFEGVIHYKIIKHMDGSTETTFYNSGVIDQKVMKYADSSYESTLYDSQGRIISSTKFDDQGEIISSINYDTQGRTNNTIIDQLRNTSEDMKTYISSSLAILSKQGSLTVLSIQSFVTSIFDQLKVNVPVGTKNTVVRELAKDLPTGKVSPADWANWILNATEIISNAIFGAKKPASAQLNSSVTTEASV